MSQIWNYTWTEIGQLLFKYRIFCSNFSCIYPIFLDTFIRNFLHYLLFISCSSALFCVRILLTLYMGCKYETTENSRTNNTGQIKGRHTNNMVSDSSLVIFLTLCCLSADISIFYANRRKSKYGWTIDIKLITVAARSKAWTVFARSKAGNVGSNVCIVCIYSVCM
jgi:hypothetical protein